jgi:hypothetical protein
MRRTAAGVGWRGRGARVAIVACLLLGLAAAQVTDEPPEVGAPPGLLAPTSPVYAEFAWYDLVAVRWVEPEANRVWLEVELAATDPAGTGPLGLRQPIVEVYVDDGGGGAATLLPGSGLRMPDGDGWRHAVRITGDGVWWWQAAIDGRGLLPPRSLPAVLDGRVVRIAWPTDLPGDVRVYAISGVYDPFSPDGWRPLAPTASPWAFASEENGPPVIDVLPGGTDAWERARDGRALVRDATASASGRGGASGWYWWALMAVGLGLASGGLWWRSRPPSAGDPSSHGAEAAAVEPGDGDDALITDAELSVTPGGGPASTSGDAPTTSTGGGPADDQPAATPGGGDADAGDAVAEGADAEGNSTRATEAPSEDSRSAKRS